MRLDEEHFRVSDARVLSEIEKNPSFKGADGRFDPGHGAAAPAGKRQFPNRNIFKETRIAAAGQPAAAGHRRFVLPDARRSSSASSISKTKNAKSQYVLLSPEQFVGKRADRRGRDQGLLRQERRPLHDHGIGVARIRRTAARAGGGAGERRPKPTCASSTTTTAPTTCSTSAGARATS